MAPRWKTRDRLCTHCKTPSGTHVFPCTGGTDIPSFASPSSISPPPVSTSEATAADKSTPKEPLNLNTVPEDVIVLVLEGIWAWFKERLDDPRWRYRRSMRPWVEEDNDDNDEDEHNTPAYNLTTERTYYGRENDCLVREFWRCVKGLYGASQSLHAMTLRFLTRKISLNAHRLDHFRRVSFEPTADSIATLKAVIHNPALASCIEEVEVVAYEPHHLLTDEKKFKKQLKTTLQVDKYFRKLDGFEQLCTIHTTWLEAREYFFEQLHMLSRHHVDEILTSAAPLLTSLNELTFTCLRPLTRSYWGTASYQPDLREQVPRGPIKPWFLHQPVQYYGLRALLRTFGGNKNINSLNLFGINMDIVKLDETTLSNLSELIGRVERLELECSPDRNFMNKSEKHKDVVQKCEKLLKATLNAKHLVIGGDRNAMRPFDNQWRTNDPSELLRIVLRQCKFPRLANLSMQWMWATPTEISNFLAHHKGHIDTLLMKAVELAQFASGKRRAWDIGGHWYMSGPWTAVLDEVRKLDVANHIQFRARGDEPNNLIYESGDERLLCEVKDICEVQHTYCRHTPFVRTEAVLKKWFKEWDMGPNPEEAVEDTTHEDGGSHPGEQGADEGQGVQW